MILESYPYKRMGKDLIDDNLPSLRSLGLDHSGEVKCTHMNYIEACSAACDEGHYFAAVATPQGRIVYRVPKTIDYQVFALFNRQQKRKYEFWREFDGRK